MQAATGEMPAVLAVCSDPLRLDRLLRLGAAAGTAVDVATSDSGAAARWASATLILVDSHCDLRLLPSRTGIIVVGDDEVAGWPLAEHLHAEAVAILPDAQAWLVRRLGLQTRRGGVIVAVFGATGGVGASVLAAGLTLAAPPGQTVLIDTDPGGLGAAHLIGRFERGASWADLDAVASAGAALATLPECDGVRVLTGRETASGSVDAATVVAGLDALVRGCDVTVVDVGRDDRVAQSVLARAHDSLLVVGADWRGLAAARRLCVPFSHRLVVRTGPGRSIDPAEASDVIGAPVAAVVADEARIRRAVEAGRLVDAGSTRLSRIAAALLTQATPS